MTELEEVAPVAPAPMADEVKDSLPVLYIIHTHRHTHTHTHTDTHTHTHRDVPHAINRQKERQNLQTARQTAFSQQIDIESKLHYVDQNLNTPHK